MATFDFDQLIQPISASEFVDIPDGEYPFIIKNVERDYYTGNSQAIEANCPYLIITYAVKLGDGQEGEIKDRLYLQDKFLWKVATLMRAIGVQPDANGHYVPNIATEFLTGKTGHLQTEKSTYTGTDGKSHTSYNVKRYIDPKKVNTQTQQMNMGVGAFQNQSGGWF